MKIINWLIAVLKRSASKSSVTFLIVLCHVRLKSSLPPCSTILSFSLPFSPTNRRHTRDKKRCVPSTPLAFHGLVASSGPMNISYTRSVSAPYSLTISSGLITLPRDLLIFSLLVPRIIPWLTNLWNGSLVDTTPRSYRTLCQKRA
ncbi:hypothetical protein D3C81_1579130 [compost metagenome]